ncbi:MAG: hypothetical protein U0572_07285 [Phycisphaerales bacterium]
MLEFIVCSDRLWSWLQWVPIILAAVGGGLVVFGFAGERGWDPRCMRCGHDLRMSLNSDACPECGEDLRVAGAIRSGQRRRRPWTIGVGLAIVVLGTLVTSVGPFPIGSLRGQLVAFVSAPRVTAAKLTGSTNTSLTLEFDRRLAANDPAIVTAIIDAAAETIRSGGAPSSSHVELIQQLDSSGAIDACGHKRISDAMTDAAIAGITDAATLLEMARMLRPMQPREYVLPLLERPQFRNRLLAVGANSGRIKAGDPNWLLLHGRTPSFMGPDVDSSVRFNISDVAYQIDGTTEWTPIPVDCDSVTVEADEGTAVFLPTERWQTPGKYLVRCRVSYEPTADARTSPNSSDDSAWHYVSVIVEKPLPWRARPVRGNAVIAEALQRLRDVGFSLEITNGLAKVDIWNGWRSSAANVLVDSSDAIAIAATVTIEQAGHAWPAGAFEILPSGGAGTSNSPGSPPSGNTMPSSFDPTRAFVVRLTPCPAMLSGGGCDDCRVLDEVLTLQMDGGDAAARTIAWSGRSADSP